MDSIKSQKDIDIMSRGGQILTEVLYEIGKMAKEGITTEDLEKKALELIYKNNAQPSFKGYRDSKHSPAFPTALCTSINEEVVHGPAIPAKRLKNGDILNLDLGIRYPKDNGLYTDMAITVGIGKISKEAQKLIDTTRESLARAVKVIKEGATVNDISRAVQQYVEKRGFSVVRSLVGHGVGYQVHENEPRIPNFESLEGKKFILKSGMTIAVEPMVCEGKFEVEVMEDGWTVVTQDRKLAAHFEHTILVTKNGAEILTKI